MSALLPRSDWLRCGECGRSFEGSRQLKMHKRSAHEGGLELAKEKRRLQAYANRLAAEATG